MEKMIKAITITLGVFILVGVMYAQAQVSHYGIDNVIESVRYR